MFARINLIVPFLSQNSGTEAAPLLHVAQVIDDAIGDLTCRKVDGSSACDSIHYRLSSFAQTASFIRFLTLDCLIAPVPYCGPVRTVQSNERLTGRRQNLYIGFSKQ
jgi:hypothetical protein